MMDTFVSLILTSYLYGIITPLLFFIPMAFVLSAFKKLSQYDS